MKRMDPSRYFGLENLDERLVPYVRRKRGTFVELGAFDGIDQSNTKWLEENRGWRGILIEPIPEAYARCVRNRPLAIVVNCACVADSYKAPTVKMIYAGLMSIVPGARSSEDDDDAWVSLGEELQQVRRYTCDVAARTLTDVLTRARLRYVDLVSLDVEGYELEVLQGLDLDAFRVRHILVEESGHDAVDSYLQTRGYRCVAAIGQGEKTRDLLYERAAPPGWREQVRRAALRRCFFTWSFIVRLLSRRDSTTARA